MRILAATGLLLVSVSAAEAQTDITFQGDIDSFCALSLPTNGSLVLDNAGRLTSEPLGFGTITVFTTGGNDLEVTQPTWDAGGYPNTYVPGGETFELSYSGLAGLGVANSGWIASDADIDMPALPISILTLNARATSPDGWVDGTYRLKVTVTCAG